MSEDVTTRGVEAAERPRVLLVEDHEADRALVRSELVDRFDVDEVATLEAAIERCQDGTANVIVLDLSLPDGWGLDTLLSLARTRPPQPIVVLTGSQPEEFEGKALRAGAASFVRKADLGSGLLGEAVAGALDRLGSGGSSTRPSVFDAPRTTSSTAAAFGVRDLLEGAPDHFERLVLRYLDLLELAIEQVSFAADYRLKTHLEDFAAELGSLGAGPRDVTAIHAQAMRRRLDDPLIAPSQTALDEARLVVLEVMGYLVLHYRLRAMGRPGRAGPRGEDP